MIALYLCTLVSYFWVANAYSLHPNARSRWIRPLGRLSARREEPVASAAYDIFSQPSKDTDIKSTIIKRISLAAMLSSAVMLSTSTKAIAESDAEVVGTSIGTVAVIGSAGKTGKLVVESLLKMGVPVRPVYRAIPSNLPEKVDPYTADVTKYETLLPALKGVSSIIFAASASRSGGKAEQVDYLGVANVAKAAIELKIPRLVVISSAAITKPDSLGFKFTNIFGRIMEYKLLGEKALFDVYKAAGDPNLSYAIIRPGGLLDGQAIGAANIELNQGDTIVGEINRADVANVAVAASISKSIPKNVVFEVYESGKGNPLEGRFAKRSGYERDGKVLGGSYDKLFEGLQPSVNGIDNL
jgi:hypothetical protein